MGISQHFTFYQKFLVLQLMDLAYYFLYGTRRILMGRKVNLLSVQNWLGNKKAFKELHSTFHEYRDNFKSVQQIWVEFAEYYNTISDFNLKADQ